MADVELRERGYNSKRKRFEEIPWKLQQWVDKVANVITPCVHAYQAHWVRQPLVARGDNPVSCVNDGVH